MQFTLEIVYNSNQPALLDDEIQLTSNRGFNKPLKIQTIYVKFRITKLVKRGQGTV